MTANKLKPSMKAGEIIKRLKIRDPSEIHIHDIAMERGALVREKILESSEAWLVRKGRLGIITVSTRIPEQGRKRFAIAHELGHFELHQDSQLIICTEQDMFQWNESKSQEIEANDFAANILMPEDIFSDHIGSESPSIDIVAKLADEFRTTLTATALRYVQLSSEPCAIVISGDSSVRWYKKSNSFEFHVKVGEKLSPNTYAFDFYDGVEMPLKPEKVPASAWIAGNVDEEADIMEHSVALNRYNVVLSLLWIHKEIRPKYRRYDEDEPEHDLTNPFTPDGKRWRW
ncbi:MAG: ImmA/IrrE family metallo-endopeptidase [Syntrophales bacterium]|nr:ImmA/IrrE family metallo-endopeptidase [Syntrophales bacterium]